MPTLAESKTIVMTDAVRSLRTSLVWPTVALGDPDEAALDALAADPRLAPQPEPPVPALQYDKPLAASANAFHRTNVLAGTFSVRSPPSRARSSTT